MFGLTQDQLTIVAGVIGLFTPLLLVAICFAFAPSARKAPQVKITVNEQITEYMPEDFWR